MKSNLENESSPNWNSFRNFIKLYFVGDSVTCTPEHPFFVNNTWVAAKDLQGGNYLLSSTKSEIRIDSLYQFKTDTATKVFNLEEAGNHNYYVSASSVLVHNCELTGRIMANNLLDEMSMEAIKKNPLLGKVVMENLSDSRWLGWSKMQYIVKSKNGLKAVIHYVGKWEDGILKAVDDFKFK